MLSAFDKLQFAGQFSIAVDANNIYWATCGNLPIYTNNDVNDGTIMSMPIGGGAAQIIANTQAYPQGIAVDANNVYWTVGDGVGATCTPSCVTPSIMFSPIGASTPTKLVETSAMNELVVSDGFLYWMSLESDGSSADIMRVSVGGGTPEIVVHASEGVDYNVKFAVDATRIYWAGAMRPGDYLHAKAKP
jgi:hypothetical protein